MDADRLLPRRPGMSPVANFNINLAALAASPPTALLLETSESVLRRPMLRPAGTRGRMRPRSPVQRVPGLRRLLPAAVTMNGNVVSRPVRPAADIEMELQLTAGFTGARE